MNIGERLKELRDLNDISVYKLAQLSEVSSTYIHEIEKGKKQPTVEVISKLCDAMNIELSDFFSDDKNTPDITIDDLIKDLNNLSPKELDALLNLIKAFKTLK